MSLGQTGTGGVASIIFKVNEHCVEFPDSSVAVNVMISVPPGPDARTVNSGTSCVIIMLIESVQLSETVNPVLV